MKFTLSIGLTLLTSTLFGVSGNAQTDSQSQPSLQPTCVAVKPLEQLTTSERSTSQRSTQVQQSSECALSTQPQTVQVKPRLSERDRLIKERFEQRIIPPQD